MKFATKLICSLSLFQQINSISASAARPLFSTRAYDPLNKQDTCYTQLANADADGDGLLSKSEYRQFAVSQMRSDASFSSVQEFRDLAFELQINFVYFDCICGVGESGNCCDGFIDIAGANPDGTHTDLQLAILDEYCSLTQIALDTARDEDTIVDPNAPATSKPTVPPTALPTASPAVGPTTSRPSSSPAKAPSRSPTVSPSQSPSSSLQSPSVSPKPSLSQKPSFEPSISIVPTTSQQPSSKPSTSYKPTSKVVVGAGPIGSEDGVGDTKTESSNNMTIILICVAFPVLAVIAAGICAITRKRRREEEIAKRASLEDGGAGEEVASRELPGLNADGGSAVISPRGINLGGNLSSSSDEDSSSDEEEKDIELGSRSLYKIRESSHSESDSDGVILDADDDESVDASVPMSDSKEGRCDDSIDSQESHEDLEDSGPSIEVQNVSSVGGAAESLVALAVAGVGAAAVGGAAVLNNMAANESKTADTDTSEGVNEETSSNEAVANNVSDSSGATQGIGSSISSALLATAVSGAVASAASNTSKDSSANTQETTELGDRNDLNEIDAGTGLSRGIGLALADNKKLTGSVDSHDLNALEKLVAIAVSRSGAGDTAELQNEIESDDETPKMHTENISSVPREDGAVMSATVAAISRSILSSFSHISSRSVADQDKLSVADEETSTRDAPMKEEDGVAAGEVVTLRATTEHNDNDNASNSLSMSVNEKRNSSEDSVGNKQDFDTSIKLEAVRAVGKDTPSIPIKIGDKSVVGASIPPPPVVSSEDKDFVDDDSTADKYISKIRDELQNAESMPYAVLDLRNVDVAKDINLYNMENPEEGAVLLKSSLGLRRSNENLNEIKPTSLKTIDHTISPERVDELYEIGTQLESGDFSRVVKCRARNTGETFSMKIVNREELPINQEAALKQEVAILSDMDHPHILRLVSAFSTTQSFYVVTEWLDGGGLFDRMVERLTYTENEARDVSKVLLSALEYCHEKHIAHRDLRPEHILYSTKDDDSQIKIAGFASARMAPREDSLETMCGHPFYISPEVLQRHRYGTKTDMWSLGVIVFILLGGYPPFYDDKEIINCGYSFFDKYWDSVSAEAKSFIKSLLVVDPRQRLSASDALNHPWMKTDGELLTKNNLKRSQDNLEHNFVRKMKSAVKKMIAVKALNDSIAKTASVPKKNREEELTPEHVDEFYEICAQLESGEFSQVVKCKARNTGETFSMKIVNKDTAPSDYAAALKNEVSLLHEMNHPHIIRLVSAFSTAESLFVVTEWIDGGVLFDRMVERSTYTENEARDVSKVLLSALEYCHKKNIAHRDLQPEQILYTSRDDGCQIKIAGFGSARKAPKEDSLETMCGHPFYISPEILQRHRYGTKTDMWSFGVIIFILLGGYPPFYEEDNIINCEYSFLDKYWDSVSAEAVIFVKSLLIVEPRKRLSASEALDQLWMKTDGDILAKNNLKHCQENLELNFVSKLKSAVKKVIAVNAIQDSITTAAPFPKRESSFSKELTPERVDQLYEIGAQLESGEFSRIVQCKARSTGECFAMKIVNRKELPENQEAALKNDISVLNELDHPHIIRLFSAFSTTQSYYVVTELLGGRGLFDRMLNRSTYTENEARDVCKVILQALEYCHEKHIAHRDLQPEILLLASKDEDCMVKITGFGRARKAPKEDSLETMCGHPFYISPEILLRHRYGTKTDMWSLGVIIFILLGGYPPFLDEDDIINCSYSFFDKYWDPISAEAKSFIESVLVVDPRQRLSASDALDHPWMEATRSRLSENNLTKTQQNLEFNFGHKFKAAVRVVMAMNALKNI